MTAQPRRPMDVFSFVSAADTQISPDGRQIFYVHTTRDIATDDKKNVIKVSSDRQTWIEVPETQGVIVARWAPDSRRVALLRKVGDKTEVVVRDIQGGISTVLTESTRPMRELAWSPDGTRVAFQMRIEEPLPAWLGLATPPAGAVWAPGVRYTERVVYRHDSYGEWPEGSYQVLVAAADGSAPPKQVTTGTWWNGMPHLNPPGLVWSTDGNEILFTGTQRPDWDAKPSETEIHAVRADGSGARQVTKHGGRVSRPAPSPDGKSLAYTQADDDRFSFKRRRLFVMPLGTNGESVGEAREILPNFDRSIEDIAWTSDSKALLVTYEAEGRREIARVTLDGKATPIAEDVGASIEMPYASGGFSVAGDGTVAYIRSAIDVPAEVTVVPPSGPARTLTGLNDAFARELNGFHAAEMFWVDGGEGRKVQCWLMLPKTKGPHPMILEIHGGPYAQYGNRFSIKYQLLAAAGYAILFTNPCGSTGYGEAFANALHDRFPGPDYDDLMAAVDVAAARPDIDANNLFVTGVSGGGVLTLWTVTHTHRFRAACSIKPVVSWESWLLTADMGVTGGLVWMGSEKPWENPGKYRARSPLAFAHIAKTPTMLMAGETDSRTPPTEAIQMYSAFKLAGIETALVRFPNTSHSSWVMRPSLFAAEVSIMLGWFERFRVKA